MALERINLKQKQIYSGTFDGTHDVSIFASIGNKITIQTTYNTNKYAVTLYYMDGGLLSVMDNSYVEIDSAVHNWRANVANKSSLLSFSDNGSIYTGISSYGNVLQGAFSTVVHWGKNTNIYTSSNNIANLTVYGSHNTVYMHKNDTLKIGKNGYDCDASKVDTVKMLDSGIPFHGSVVEVLVDSSVNFKVSGTDGAYIKLDGHDKVTLADSGDIVGLASGVYGPSSIYNFNANDMLDLRNFKNITDAASLLAHTTYYKGYTSIDLRQTGGPPQTLELIGVQQDMFETFASNGVVYSTTRL